MDRFDLRIEVPPVDFTDLDGSTGDSSAEIAARVARRCSGRRYQHLETVLCKRRGEEIAAPDAEGRALLTKAADFGLTARATCILRTARTIADLDHSENR